MSRYELSKAKEVVFLASGGVMVQVRVDATAAAATGYLTGAEAEVLRQLLNERASTPTPSHGLDGGEKEGMVTPSVPAADPASAASVGEFCKTCGGDGFFEEAGHMDAFNPAGATRRTVCTACGGTGQ